MIPSLKNIVKGTKSHFEFYKANNLYYSVSVEGKEYIFTVPIDDIGDGIFHHEEKTMLLMRYVRKALEVGAFVPYLPELS